MWQCLPLGQVTQLHPPLLCKPLYCLIRQRFPWIFRRVVSEMNRWFQTQLVLAPRSRGFHLITDEVVSELPLAEFRIGMLHVFIQHTSASLTINENADPDVRRDFETVANYLVPSDLPYRHTCEGPDDMPAHVKGSLMGFQLQIPVTNGRLNLGTWQGIYLCEHRDRGGARRLVLTVHGEGQYE